MTERERREALRAGRPSVNLAGEPALGSIYGDEEVEAAVRAIRASMDPEVGFRTHGTEAEPFEAELAAFFGTKCAVTVNSAGAGLDLAVRALDLKPGDEVICPSINFKAAPMAIVGQGGRWVPCEVDPRTLQADPADVESRMSPRTRAILPVHMNGLSAPMDDLMALAERHPHPVAGPPRVIGDAARACGGGYRGARIGKHGWLTVFSFHTQKNMTTLGEGGAITTDDEAAADRIRQLRFFGGHDGWGSSCLMTNVQAAVGRVQLRRLPGLIEARRRLAADRTRLLAECEELTLPHEPDDCVHSYYLYTILVPRAWSGPVRDRLCAMLRDEYHVHTIIANPPVHSTVPYLQAHVGEVHLPISEDVGARLFCPPIQPAMSDDDNRYICAAILDAVERMKRDAPAA